MRCFASSATSRLTPASAYFMVCRLNVLISDATFAGEACRLITCGAEGGHEGRVTRHESLCGRSFFYFRNSSGTLPVPDPYSLKQMEQPAPPHRAGMYQRVGIRQEPCADIPVPCFLRRVQRHINDHWRA